MHANTHKHRACSIWYAKIIYIIIRRLLYSIIINASCIHTLKSFFSIYLFVYASKTFLSMKFNSHTYTSYTKTRKLIFCYFFTKWGPQRKYPVNWKVELKNGHYRNFIETHILALSVRFRNQIFTGDRTWYVEKTNKHEKLPYFNWPSNQMVLSYTTFFSRPISLLFSSSSRYNIRYMIIFWFDTY